MANWLFAQITHVFRLKSNSTHADLSSLQEVVLNIKFCQNQLSSLCQNWLSSFRDVRRQKLPLPVTLATGRIPCTSTQAMIRRTVSEYKMDSLQQPHTNAMNACTYTTAFIFAFPVAWKYSSNADFLCLPYMHIQHQTTQLTKWVHSGSWTLYRHIGTLITRMRGSAIRSVRSQW